MIEKPSIAVVFATMDRSPTAVSCVRALAAQTLPPSKVIISDNVSQDTTVADLEALPDLPFDLILHQMRENRGNAGGVEEAMELAFSMGADAVWILDDDSWPRSDALEIMLEEPFDPAVIPHPLQIDPTTGKFTWPLQIYSDGNWKLIDCVEQLPPGKRTRSRGVWTGALVSKLIRDKIGPVMGELFIRGEDEEYPWRMETHGFTHRVVHDAIMDHPGPSNIVHWSLLGKNFFFERALVDWKLYYKVRNMVWLKRKQSSGAKALLIFAAYLGATCRFDGFGRFSLLWRAFKDGWNGNLGKMS